MLVGVLQGSSLAEYGALSRGSPLPIVVPPVVYLSTPSEVLSRELTNRLSVKEETITVEMQTVLFKNIYNQKTSLPGYYASLKPTQGTSDELRKGLGVHIEGNFCPFMLIAHDGMRSRATRYFLRSFADALAKSVLEFQLHIASSYKNEHLPIFDAYAEEAFELLGQDAGDFA